MGDAPLGMYTVYGPLGMLEPLGAHVGPEPPSRTPRMSHYGTYAGHWGRLVSAIGGHMQGPLRTPHRGHGMRTSVDTT